MKLNNPKLVVLLQNAYSAEKTAEFKQADKYCRK